jgi:hypothetical protein
MPLTQTEVDEFVEANTARRREAGKTEMIEDEAVYRVLDGVLSAQRASDAA